MPKTTLMICPRARSCGFCEAAKPHPKNSTCFLPTGLCPTCISLKSRPANKMKPKEEKVNKTKKQTRSI